MTFKIYALALCALILGCSAWTWAQNSIMDEQLTISKTNFSGVVGSGARAFGMGGAFIAVADDATAASWNPAGLGQLEKSGFSLVGRYQNTRDLIPAYLMQDTLVGATNSSSASMAFDFASFTYPVRVWGLKLVPQISYQRSSSFGYSRQMHNVLVKILRLPANIDSSAGLLNTDETFHGGLDTVTLSLAASVSDRIHVGFSLNYWFNGFSGSTTKTFKYTNYSTAIGDQTLSALKIDTIDAKISGWNSNLGMLFKLKDNLRMGLVYKSGFNQALDLTATSHLEVAPPLNILDGEIKLLTQFYWPETYGIGIAFAPSDPLTLSADFTWTRWSKAIIKNYTLDDPQMPHDIYFPTFLPVGEDTTTKQVDSYQMRLGFEYIFIKGKTMIPLRFGIFTDNLYFTDASGEPITFLGLTAGVGYKWRNIEFDVAALYETGSFLESIAHYAVTNFRELRVYFSTIINL